jgi:hypothetical protein
MDAHDAHPTGDRPTDLDVQILDLLREDARSAGRLVEVLDHEGEEVGLEAVRSRLEWLASRRLVRNPPAGSRADPWEITEEGRALVEPQAGVARAPYERDVGGQEDGGRDAGFWVLVAIAVVTAACAAYSLLVSTGVLGGA